MIRPEGRDEAGAVAAVVAAAFGRREEADLVEALRDSSAWIPGASLVAESGGRVVGHVLLSRGQVVGDDRQAVAVLAPLAVAPEAQGRGWGGALVRAALARAVDLGEAAVVLEGDPAYYGRWGFEFAPPLGLHMDLPDWAPPRAAQVHRLGHDTVPQGRLVLPEAFGPEVGGPPPGRGERA